MLQCCANSGRRRLLQLTENDSNQTSSASISMSTMSVYVKPSNSPARRLLETPAPPAEAGVPTALTRSPLEARLIREGLQSSGRSLLQSCFGFNFPGKGSGGSGGGSGNGPPTPSGSGLIDLLRSPTTQNIILLIIFLLEQSQQILRVSSFSCYRSFCTWHRLQRPCPSEIWTGIQHEPGA